nr:glycosyltransferase family 2 protein [Nanoarchaeota archaeon]
MKTYLSIVIPTYNEEENILRLYKSIRKTKPNSKYEIIFVNDGSTDKSQEILEKLHKKDQSVKVIKFTRNFGQSSALDAGIKLAKGGLIVTIDADLQNDPSDIPRLIRKIKNSNYDFVCGWRKNRQDSFSKKLYSKIANFIRRIVFGEKIHDAGCTLRIYKRTCFKNFHLYGQMHRYLPTILYLRDFKAGEMVVRHHKRRFGKTKYSGYRLIGGFIDLIIIRTSYSNRFNKPLHNYRVEKVLD